MSKNKTKSKKRLQDVKSWINFSYSKFFFTEEAKIRGLYFLELEKYIDNPTDFFLSSFQHSNINPFLRRNISSYMLMLLFRYLSSNEYFQRNTISKTWNCSSTSMKFLKLTFFDYSFLSVFHAKNWLKIQVTLKYLVYFSK